MEKQNFFYKQQFGLRKNHRTTHALSILVNKVTDSIANKKPTLGIFLDLFKTFDTIDHNVLLAKLHYNGVKGIALDWLRSYLSKRSQQVVCSNVLSSNINLITIGVHQGSNLGPILFLIYVTDFPKCLKFSDPIMFDDDTNVFIQNNNLKHLFNEAQLELQNIDQWMIANKLSIIISKTKCVLFKSPRSKPTPSHLHTTLRGKKIEQVSTLKFLRVHIDEHLSWTKHAKYLLGKLRCGIRAITKVKYYLHTDTLLILHHSLINSLQYCISD